jgi:hypothetical protein
MDCFKKKKKISPSVQAPVKPKPILKRKTTESLQRHVNKYYETNPDTTKMVIASPSSGMRTWSIRE